MSPNSAERRPLQYAPVRTGIKLEECEFYHTIELPDVGLVLGVEGGNWDLRPHVEEFLGGIDFRGKTVLEIGPASGFLTFEMERRGASVTCIDIPPDHKYDVIPYPEVMERYQKRVDGEWLPLTNSWWFAREKFRSNARVAYVGANDLDAYDTEQFDIVFISNMLLHNRDPLKVLKISAGIARESVVVVDIADRQLEEDGRALLRFLPEPIPDPVHVNWNQWWRLSSRFVADSLSVLGFRGRCDVSRFSPRWNGIEFESFRVIRSRTGAPPVMYATAPPSAPAHASVQPPATERSEPRVSEDAGVVNADIARLSAEIARLRAENEAIRASTSWRLTAPLRALSSTVRGK